MLSSTLNNLNHSDSSESSTCSNDTILKANKINEYIKSSKLGSVAKPVHSNPSKLFSIDSILKINKKHSISSKKSNETDSSSATDEGEDGEEKTTSSQSSMKSPGLDANSLQFNCQLLNNSEATAEQSQLQKNLYDQLLLNNIQNTIFKNCFSNPSSAQLLLSSLANQQQLQDFSGLSNNLAQLSQAAALANNYFLHSKTNSSKSSQQTSISSLCNSTSSLSSSSSSLSSSSDLSNNNKMSPSLSPVTGNINNTHLGGQLNIPRNGGLSTNSQQQQEAMHKQNSEFKNYFGAIQGGALNANQFQRLTDMAGGFAQNAPFSNYNPFMNMNSNNGKSSDSNFNLTLEHLLVI